MNQKQIRAAVEAMLFANAEPVETDRLAEAMRASSVKSVKKSFITSYATSLYDILDNSSRLLSNEGILSGTNKPPSGASPFNIACDAVTFTLSSLVLL